MPKLRSGADTKTPEKTGKKPRSRMRTWLSRIGLTTLILFIIAGLAGLGTFAYLYSTAKLPDPNKDFQTNTTFIYYDDGSTTLGSLAVQNRVTLSYAQMPQVMKDAVIAAENRTFWTDPGFSATGIARNVWALATTGDLPGGGSTITQQYIKVLYLDSAKRLSRKLNELVLAVKMGREVPKETILEGYLNTIYFGRGAYGIEAASRSYFLKSASDLTVQEAAALAAILNQPSSLNPSNGEAARKRLLGRYQYVIDGMLELGAITQAQRDEAYPALPKFPEVPTNNRYSGANGFVMKMVESELEGLGFSEDQVQGGGLRIITTINKTMQESAVQAAQTYTEKAATQARKPQDPSKLHVSVATVDTATGGVKAVYGGADYTKNQFNWATTARSAASTFKTFATAAALENGFSLQSTFKGNSYTPKGDGVPVRNSGYHQYGTVTLRKAVSDSINTAFVDLVEQMKDGANKVAETANRAGAPTNRSWDINNRIALGGAEVSPVNMANAYATFANDGVANQAHLIAKVESRTGEVLYEAKASVKQTFDSNVAANVTDALTSVVDQGTAVKASDFGRPIAGKTGTHEVDGTIRTAWFVGYTKQLSTAVLYVAGDSGNEPLEPYMPKSASGFFGGGYPLDTWMAHMKVATKDMKVLNFTEAKTIRPTTGGSEGGSPTPASTQPVNTPSAETPVSTPTQVPSAVASDQQPGAVVTAAPSQAPVTQKTPEKVATPAASTSAVDKPAAQASKQPTAAATKKQAAPQSADSATPAVP